MVKTVNQKVARTSLNGREVWFCSGHFLMAYFALAISGLLFFAGQVNAQETFCAEVTIQIQQELTLERQAFDAHMRINNGVDGFPVENVNIDVKFTDENGDPVEATSNPQNTTASFFIQVDQLSGIGDITGAGVVPPASSADINWLIIPAPGSGSAVSTGKLYFVGATLSYTLNGENKVTEITPDFIYVKPMPLLSLDYFLPTDVYADDPLTTPIEPIVPFTLGVRVNNQGQATAHNLKIDSSQPEIIDNQLGLLIDFRIISSFVDDQSVNPTLLLDFGDIPAGSAKMGRWQMETTLSGQFTSFTAEFSHSNELGGQLTSLLETVVTHELVRDVLVDLPGRDGVNDFLAKEAAGFKVYESNGVDTVVEDQSSSANMTLSNTQAQQSVYTLTTPPTSGFLYAQLPDPHSENKGIVRVTRSDGKELDPANFWLSKTRDGASSWNYFVNFFDQNSTGSYTVVMESLATNPQPPVLQLIPDRQVVAGNQISFIVEASDPNNTLPTITASPLPTGASFFPDPQGPAGISTYIFDWTPSVGQIGDYNIEYTASDGQLQTSQTALITVYAVGDTTPPVITVLGNNPETIFVGTPYVDAGATATDDVDGPVAVVTTGLPINTSIPGVFQVNYFATDSSGNNSVAVRTVNVIPVPVARNDFDGDGDSDLLAVHEDGTLVAALVENSVFGNFGVLGSADPAQGWTVNSTGDVNADGKADILLYNTTTGEYRVIIVDGTSVLTDTVMFIIDPLIGAEPRGMADFDGDGEAEIILYIPTSGGIGLTYLTRGAFDHIDAVITVDVSNNYILRDYADFTGDGKTDLLTENTVTGEATVIEMDGSTPLANTPILVLEPSFGLTLEGTGDFTGDDKTDVLSLHTSAALGVIIMDGLTYQTIYLPGSLQPNWELVNAGRYDGDNKADFLFFDPTTGEVITGIQDGTAITSFNTVLVLGPASGWSFHSGKP